MAENIFPNLENEKLVEVMKALRENENPDTQNAFLSEAVKSRYFSPVDVLDGNGNPLEGSGKMAVPKDAKFNFKLIRNQNGEQFFPLFTDIAEYQKWSKDSQVKTIVVTFPQMAHLVNKKVEEIKGFVINPMGENLIFPKALLDDIFKHAQKKAAEAAKAQTPETKQVQLMFGKPVNIPDSVINSLKKNLIKNSEVNSAYFLMMKQDEREHYLFVLDIDADAEKSKKIADSFCASAKLFLSKFPIVAVPLKSPIGESAPKVTEPFYTK